MATQGLPLRPLLLGLRGAIVGWFFFTKALGIGDNETFDLAGIIGAVIGSVRPSGLLVRQVAQHRLQCIDVVRQP